MRIHDVPTINYLHGSWKSLYTCYFSEIFTGKTSARFLSQTKQIPQNTQKFRRIIIWIDFEEEKIDNWRTNTRAWCYILIYFILVSRAVTMYIARSGILKV